MRLSLIHPSDFDTEQAQARLADAASALSALPTNEIRLEHPWNRRIAIHGSMRHTVHPWNRRIAIHGSMRHTVHPWT